MTELTEQITRELLALCKIHPELREQLSEAWYVGFHAGKNDDDLNSDPFAKIHQQL